jgi:hypothetical protein
VRAARAVAHADTPSTPQIGSTPQRPRRSYHPADLEAQVAGSAVRDGHHSATGMPLWLRQPAVR